MLNYKGYSRDRFGERRGWAEVLILRPDGLARRRDESDMTVPAQDSYPTLWAYALKGVRVRVWKDGAMEPSSNCHIVDRDESPTLEDVPEQFRKRVDSLLRSL